jgi:hypothetical protein
MQAAGAEGGAADGKSGTNNNNSLNTENCGGYSISDTVLCLRRNWSKYQTAVTNKSSVQIIAKQMSVDINILAAYKMLSTTDTPADPNTKTLAKKANCGNNNLISHAALQTCLYDMNAAINNLEQSEIIKMNNMSPWR